MTRGDAYLGYWKNEPGKAIGVMAVSREEDRYYMQDLVISPDRRGMRTSSLALKELLENGENQTDNR